MNIVTVYVLVRNDEFELPVYVADTIEEVAEHLKISVQRAKRLIKKDVNGYGLLRLIAVNLDLDEEY